MLDDLDIYRAANILIREHGEDAPIIAAMRIDAMAERGDEEGCQVWQRILKAVDALRAKGPPDGRTVH